MAIFQIVVALPGNIQLAIQGSPGTRMTNRRTGLTWDETANKHEATGDVRLPYFPWNITLQKK
jgi:hypothetical protein